MNNLFLKHFNKFEKIILILILLYSGGAWLFRPPISVAAETGEFGIGPISRLINLGIYAITALLIIIRWKRFLYALTKKKLLMLTLIIVLGSVLWSVSPEHTISDNKGITRVTVLGIYIATRYPLKELMNILAWTFGLAATFSFLYCIIFPDLGIQVARFGETSGWRGMYFHKNSYGRQMSFASILFLTLALKKRQYSWLLWALFGISLSQLLLSNSKTALLCFIITNTWMVIFPILRQRKKIVFFMMPLIISILGASLISIITNLEFIIVDLLGKSMTFTGRLPVWVFLLEKIGEKPLIGYGQSAFWPMISKDSEFVNSFAWAGHAHNGFIELALSIGIIGFASFSLSFIIDYSRAITFSTLADTAENVWPLQFFTIIIVTNVAVNSTFFQPHLSWMLYVIVSYSMSLEFDRLNNHRTILYHKNYE